MFKAVDAVMRSPRIKSACQTCSEVLESHWRDGWRACATWNDRPNVRSDAVVGIVTVRCCPVAIERITSSKAHPAR
eukprot:5203223-Amphidinium_carterae.1